MYVCVHIHIVGCGKGDNSDKLMLIQEKNIEHEWVKYLTNEIRKSWFHQQAACERKGQGELTKSIFHS